MTFENRVVLVTGSSSGIGLATAVYFAERGDIVVVHGPDDSQELQDAYMTVSNKSPSSSKVSCDLTDSSAIRGMFSEVEEKVGGLNILVNNAASQNPASFLELSEEDWDRVLAVNLKAPFLCSQLAAGLMIKQGGGKIINIGSVHQSQPRRNFTHYSTSKGGLAMLTRSMALELAEHNIQVNQVAPGAIATRLTDTTRQEQFLEVVPAKRIGEVSEIASLVYYLASKDADYITGSSFTVDGGLTLGFCASRPDL
jgi:glucose 1-dehydrogenase